MKNLSLINRKSIYSIAFNEALIHGNAVKFHSFWISILSCQCA